MKRRLALLQSVAVTLLFTGVVWAQEDSHGRDVKEILQQIMQKQNVERVGAIDPDEVDMELMEELGDGVMGLIIADEEQHEWMDRMMGGEGSTQLASVHRRLGYSYLQSDGNLPALGPGMMGFGMLGPGMMGSWNWGTDNRGPWSDSWGDRRGWYGSTPFTWWGSPFLWPIGLLVSLLLMAFIIAIVRTRGPRNGSRTGQSGSESAFAILQARYAQGDLSQEEFRRMKKELQ